MTGLSDCRRPGHSAAHRWPGHTRQSTRSPIMLRYPEASQGDVRRGRRRNRQFALTELDSQAIGQPFDARRGRRHRHGRGHLAEVAQDTAMCGFLLGRNRNQFASECEKQLSAREREQRRRPSASTALCTEEGGGLLCACCRPGLRPRYRGAAEDDDFTAAAIVEVSRRSRRRTVCPSASECVGPERTRCGSMTLPSSAEEATIVHALHSR